ncbi:alpha/beta hydrolase [Actinomadura sp. GTD37]|uniref:alpha/beta hydrolase n=1 Tax=Actinomadura sp. GTD37 TaxID=1778030 RepID=UPI0035BF66F3
MKTLLACVAAVACSASPGVSASATEGPVPGRRLVTLDVPSKLVDTGSQGGAISDAPRNLKVNVVLPAGYDRHRAKSYPVLWLLHGMAGEYDDFLGYVKKYLLDTQAVIVMPDGGLYGMYSDWRAGGGMTGPQWASYHLDHLLPLIERRFRIRPERRWHAIAGISMGAQGALRYASFRPGYFGSVAALSPAMPNTRGLDMMFGLPLMVLVNGGTGIATSTDIWGPVNGAYAKATNPADLVRRLKRTRVYLSSGNGVPCSQDRRTPTLPVDIVLESAVRLQTTAYAKRLRGAGVDLTERRPGCGVHTFGVWDRAFVDLLRTWGFYR